MHEYAAISHHEGGFAIFLDVLPKPLGCSLKLPRRIFTSPLVRCVETADFVAGEFGVNSLYVEAGHSSYQSSRRLAFLLWSGIAFWLWSEGHGGFL